MIRALLIPVKDLTRAKQRLAPVLSQPDRTALAEAMFEDVCHAIVGVRGLDRVILVSSFEPAIERARGLDWEYLRETTQESESASVDAASRICAASGIGALMRLPVDLPLIEASDIECVFAHATQASSDGNAPAATAGSPALRETRPCVVLTPSRCGTGTNALLRSPPDLFPSHFGPYSFGKHLKEAAACGARTEIVRNWRLELDIDDASDAREFLAQAHRGRATKTQQWLLRAGFQPRTAVPPGAAYDADQPEARGALLGDCW